MLGPIFAILSGVFAVSDAACAVLVKKGEMRSQILTSAASTNADFADHIHLKEGEEFLWMNSDETEDRAISKEYETRYTAMIKTALDQANLKINEVDHLFMNQGDHRLIDKLTTLLPIDSDKIYRSHKNFGHIGASDCFLGLKSRLERGEINPGQNIVLASSAVGFSWGATVIKA